MLNEQVGGNKPLAPSGQLSIEQFRLLAILVEIYTGKDFWWKELVS